VEIKDLVNHRLSYQVLITFDLVGADSPNYEKFRGTLVQELELEKQIHLSIEDGGRAKPLPHNTMAALWLKDSSEQETRDYFARQVDKAFKKHQLHGRYVILVAQNWAVAANEV
jgi:hypothetical protein